MSSENAIKVENLSKAYQIYDQPNDRLKQFVLPRLQRAAGMTPRQYYHDFWALKDVSFEVKKGETIGIIGTIRTIRTIEHLRCAHFIIYLLFFLHNCIVLHIDYVK